MSTYQPKDPECPVCQMPNPEDGRLREAGKDEWGDDIHQCKGCGVIFAANYEADGDWEGWTVRTDFTS